MFCWPCCVMLVGTALYVRLLVYAGLSLFIISGLYVYMVVCIVYAYNLTVIPRGIMQLLNPTVFQTNQGIKAVTKIKLFIFLALPQTKWGTILPVLPNSNRVIS